LSKPDHEVVAMKNYNFELVSISEATRFYGVSVVTMRRWDRQNKLKSHSRTLGNHRRYKLHESQQVRVGYARVSSHVQKKDLATQSAYLSQFCDVVLEDLGSGLNCKKPRLRKLITMLLNKQISELHLSHKDRLLRFGHELVFQLCKWSGANVVVHKEEEILSFEQELCKDVITLMTVFSARMYGRRSHQNRKLAKGA
jgi:predicted site-specific integrase-resolvase